MVRTIYNFFRGRTAGDLGVGALGLSYERSQTLPLYDGFYTPRYAVQGQLAVQAPGFVKENQQFVPVSLVGNGIGLQGQLALQALSQQTGG